ncbi:glycosyltransferase [Vagococcus sp. BWB3-3]|uniref:Glycosyltransferase n=1 Tax=Vagococcus allomyrinae TaxID=2794353 RepID=A0A940P8I5_9ENTE|nr:glycosyltransferase [Vagococcus allomyrinae]MBP1043669.1 glycosyltransferase [Vagococcus allomyrinae]
MRNANVSLLMSIYKNETVNNFNACMESILRQTFLPVEIVLVKDGPLTKELDQAIAEAVEKYPNNFWLVPLEKNYGLGEALSIGLQKTSFSLVARMDTDDIMREDRIEKEYLYLQAHPEVAIVGSNIVEFEGTVDNIIGQREVKETNSEIVNYSKRRNPFNHMTVMYRKERVLEAGNYLPLPGFEDYFLWVRMLKNGSQGANILEPLVYAQAGEEMINRRGGLAYFKQGAVGRWKIYKNGFGSIIDYGITFIGHTIFCLIPPKMRSTFYNTLLRKKITHGED